MSAPAERAVAQHRDYGHDANGSVEELQSAEGTVATGERYVYDPYGELDRPEDPRTGDALGLSAAARENPFRWEGFYYDSAVKTYDMQARNYRPDIGRFLTQDRFESSRGDYNLQSDPLTQNRYVFARANPVNRVEYDGHDAMIGIPNRCDRRNTANCGPASRRQGLQRRPQRVDPGYAPSYRVGGHSYSPSPRLNRPRPGGALRPQVYPLPSGPGNGNATYSDATMSRGHQWRKTPAAPDGARPERMRCTTPTAAGCYEYFAPSYSPGERLFLDTALSAAIPGGLLARGFAMYRAAQRGKIASRVPQTGRGIVYRRTDLAGGKPYVGQSKSEARFLARQREHARENPFADYRYTILGRENPGAQLDRLEEYFIRRLGGPTTRRAPTRGLANRRHQMNPERYWRAGGDY